MRKPYPSDLTDEQWAIIEPLIPVHSASARPREVDMREVLNAIFYLNRSGCQWDMLPHDLPAKSTVYDHFAQWQGRRHLAGDPGRPAPAGPRGRRSRAQPRASASIDSQTVKATEVADEPGLRRGQEDQRAEATYHRGHAGFAAGGRGVGGVGRRRDVRARGAGPTDGRAPDPVEERLGRREVPQPLTSTPGW